MAILCEGLCSLTPFENRSVHETLSFFSSKNVELQVYGKMGWSNMQILIDSWYKSSEPLEGEPRKDTELFVNIWKVALILWRIIIKKQKESDVIEALKTALLELQRKERLHAHTKVLRLFLGKQSSAENVPFTAFYRDTDLLCHSTARVIDYQSLPMDESIRAQETIYARDGPEHLFVCHGKCVKVSFDGSEGEYRQQFFVTCIELTNSANEGDPFKIPCSDWELFGCKEGQSITFMIRLREKGLWAHGIQREDRFLDI